MDAAAVQSRHTRSGERDADRPGRVARSRFVDRSPQAHLENESRFLVATDVVAALRHGAERPTRATDQEIGSVECEEDDRRAAFRRACTECSRDLPT